MQEQLSGFRLSAQQKRLLSLGFDGASNRARCAILLEGRADESALREALSQVVGRHEILRTKFRQVPGIKLPLQFVEEASEVVWYNLELEGADPREEEAEFERVFRLVGERQHKGEGELSATLLNLADQRRVLYLSASPLCADAATLLNLAVEVGRAYEAIVEGEESEDEPIQYLVFSEWQNDLLEKEESEEGLAFWRRREQTDATPVTLPGESKALRDAAFSPTSHSFAFDAGRVAALDSAAERHGATPDAFLLACWQSLLWRLTSQAEFVVAATLDGRKFEALEDVHGPFAKALPLAAAFDGRERFDEVLARADESLAEAFDWQEYFAWGQADEARPDEGRATFLPIGFESLVWPAPFEAAGLRFTIRRHFACADRFRLKLLCVRACGELRFELQYDPACYVGEAVARLAGQFLTLLEGAVRNTQTPVGSLPLLAEQERQFLLHDWNATRASFPSQLCLQQLFEQQAQCTPDAIAVTAGQCSLTYSQLDSLSNRLARLLRSRGVGPESVVGILMRRSAEMLASLLAVLKAGGAYLPLDPALPSRRLSFMLEDADSRLLLTQPSLLQTLNGIETPHTLQVVEVDPDCRALTGHEDKADDEALDAKPLPNTAAPENLAYVIYTSGSTGRPKGVMVTHRSVVNYLAWALDAYEVAAGASPVHSPLSFDLTVTSLWPPLLSGGRVELLGEEAGVEGLAEALPGGGYGVVKLTPAHLEVLRRILPEEAASAAAVMVIGGEALWAEAVKFWREHAPQVRLINEYGPTEATVGCCVYEVRAEDEIEGAVPIGRPIANARLYVLDAKMEPVPAGVKGGLYIGGECLARGYLNRPGLTAERFVPDPFGCEAGGRLYRTGDVVRHGAGGEMEYVGRADEQVKVSGFRVELGEVEAVLSAHEQVREAVAAAREDGSGAKRVVAYIVPEAGAAPTAAVLRGHMRERVPEYMIPSHFVTLEKLPLTPNGKVDKRALPEPEGVVQDGPRILARDVTELRLARIWEELLGMWPVGVRDNFFELGGNSMQAARLMFRIRETFGRELPLSVIFRESTVERLAGLLRSRQAASQRSSALVEIQPHGTLEPFFCVHPGGGGTLCYAPLAQHLGQGRPFYGLQSRGLDGEEAPRTSVEEMAEQYIREVRRVRPAGPYMLGGWSMGGVVAYEMAQQLRAQHQEVALLALIDSFAPPSSGTDAEPDELSLLESFARDIGLSPEALAFAADESERFRPCELLGLLLERLKAQGLLPPDLELARLRRHFNVFKSNVRAMLAYRPRPSPDPITLFVTEEKLAGGGNDPANGWAQLAAAGMEVHVAPGDHFTMLREPQVRTLAGLLRGSLDARSAVNA